MSDAAEDATAGNGDMDELGWNALGPGTAPIIEVPDELGTMMF